MKVVIRKPVPRAAAQDAQPAERHAAYVFWLICRRFRTDPVAMIPRRTNAGRGDILCSRVLNKGVLSRRLGWIVLRPEAVMTDMPDPAHTRVHILSSLRGYQAEWLPKDISAGLAIAAWWHPQRGGLSGHCRIAARDGILREHRFGHRICAVRSVAAADRRSRCGDHGAFLGGVIGTVLAGLPAASPVDRAVAAAAIAVGVVRDLSDRQCPSSGNLASLLSRPILVGFFVGVAISIIVGQIGGLPGCVSSPKVWCRRFSNSRRSCETSTYHRSCWRRRCS